MPGTEPSPDGAQQVVVDCLRFRADVAGELTNGRFGETPTRVRPARLGFQSTLQGTLCSIIPRTVASILASQ
jgi:hypothetical protein